MLIALVSIEVNYFIVTETSSILNLTLVTRESILATSLHENAKVFVVPLVIESSSLLLS